MTLCKTKKPQQKKQKTGVIFTWFWVLKYVVKLVCMHHKCAVLINWIYIKWSLSGFSEVWAHQWLLETTWHFLIRYAEEPFHPRTTRTLFHLFRLFYCWFWCENSRSIFWCKCHHCSYQKFATASFLFGEGPTCT